MTVAGFNRKLRTLARRTFQTVAVAMLTAQSVVSIAQPADVSRGAMTSSSEARSPDLVAQGADAADESADGLPRSARVPDGFTLASVGDIIYTRPMRRDLAKQASSVLRLVRGADVAFGNFEATALNLSTFVGYPEAESGGAWIVASHEVPEDLRSMGFDMLSIANNHAMDWGATGLRQSQELLAEANLVAAGAGPSLSAARAPRYYQGATARVALVAVTSTFPVLARAGDAFGEIGARPGVNALRVIAGTMNERDKGAILHAIRLANRTSNFVIVSLHTHEPNEVSPTPADFAVLFARAAVDAGADAVIGHGCHRLRGIEIYKGRPIFYSLGNFFFAMNDLYPIPLDSYDELDVDPQSMTAAQFMRYRNRLVHTDSRKFESVIALSRFQKGQLSEVRLYPIELGYSSEGPDHGSPRMASADAAGRILNDLQSKSAPMGTNIKIKRSIGIVIPNKR